MRSKRRKEYAIHIYLHVPERNFYCLAADVGGEKFIKGSSSANNFARFKIVYNLPVLLIWCPDYSKSIYGAMN